MQSLKTLSHTAILAVSAVVPIFLLAFIFFVECDAANELIQPSGVGLVQSYGSVPVKSSLSRKQPISQDTAVDNSTSAASSGTLNEQKHATSLTTIADQLNVKIAPYDQPLFVTASVNNTLPNNSVTLKAVINHLIISQDDKTAGDLYDFQWTVNTPAGTANQQPHWNYSSNLAWASLTNLMPGNFTVKLAVSRHASDAVGAPTNYSSTSSSAASQRSSALGEAVKTIVVRALSSLMKAGVNSSSDLLNGNNSLTPPPNHPPVAEISPSGTRRLTKPGPVVFVDVSKENDAGDSIVERKWAVVEKPATYSGFPKNSSENSAQLELNNLPRGDYMLQLTVKDSHGATNSTSVRILAAYEDRPPVALVAGDAILRLSESSPETNQVTLDGSKSSDDNGIVSYEWTRMNHLDEPLDIKGTNKPILTVSGFQHLGDYIFNLTVKDASNQIDSHEVHVLVVKSEGDDPRAVAGDDLTVMAPVQAVVLNGTLSKPLNQLSFMWSQTAGPSRVIIENADRPVAYAKNFLVPGEYQFQLSVKHLNNSRKSETKLKVVVGQGTNKAPVADAGPDRQVSLPFPVFSVNGSTSSDDLGIEHYTWLVDDNNPAGATVVDNSQHESVLKVRGLVAGVHKFHLTVSDAQQLSSNASVTIEVLPDKFELDRVELVIKPNLHTLRQSNINDIEHALFLILSHHDNIYADKSSENHTSYFNIFVDAVESDRSGDNTRVIFHVVEHLLPAIKVDGPTAVGISDLAKNTSPKSEASEVTVVDGLAVVDQLRRYFERYRAKKLVGLDVLLVDTFVCRNPCSGHGECNNATKRCQCHRFWWPSPIRALLGDGQSNCDWSTFYAVLFVLALALFAFAVVQGFLGKQHLLDAKIFLCRAVNNFIAARKNPNVVGGDNSGSESSRKLGKSQRPRRRRYRLLDNSPSLLNEIDDTSIAIPNRRRSVKSNGALPVNRNEDVETSLEMTKRQYYSGHRQQRQQRSRSALNAAYDDDEEQEDEESDSETLYAAASARRQVPQSTLTEIGDHHQPRQRVSSNGTSTSGDIATFGSSGSSRNQLSSSPVAKSVISRRSPAQLQVQFGRAGEQNRNQSATNLSHDSGIALT